MENIKRKNKIKENKGEILIKESEPALKLNKNKSFTGPIPEDVVKKAEQIKQSYLPQTTEKDVHIEDLAVIRRDPVVEVLTKKLKKETAITQPPVEEEQKPSITPLKIALLSWETLHSIAVGGISVHVTELAAALERMGHEVHVFTRMSSWGTAQYGCIDNVHYHWVPYQGHHDFVEDVNNMCRSFVHSVFHVEDYMGAHFDVVHAHDWMTSNAMVWIKQGRGRKGILTIHSTEYGRCGNNFYDGPSGRIRDHERNGTYCADRVIAVSNTLKGEVMWMYNLPDWKIHSIYNGVNYHHFEGFIDPGDIKKRFNIHPFDPMVLFVGRMAYQKGPDLLMEAIPRVLCTLPNVKFVFAGDGHLRGSVEASAHQLGVAHATRFLGYQDAWALRDLFRACDCVCVPSRNEPFGIVILEAWSAGKPVVATTIGGPAEFVWHDVTGFKINPNPDSIAWGLGTLFGNFEHARWMGRNGRYAVEKDFSWDIIADHTYHTYLC